MRNDDRRSYWDKMLRRQLVVFISFFLIIPLSLVAQRIQPSTRVPFSVNFISIGAGTDHKAKEKLHDFLKAFEQQQKVRLDFKIKNWGKEGESEYIFDLKTLSAKQRGEFKGTVQKMFKENNLVRITTATR